MFLKNVGNLKECILQNVQEGLKYIFYYPLQILYLKGPSFGSFGFWNGKSYADICSQLTNVPSSTWESSYVLQDECKNLIEKNFNSFYISLLSIYYFYIMYALYNYYWYRYFYWKPFLKDIQILVENKKKKN